MSYITKSVKVFLNDNDHERELEIETDPGGLWYLRFKEFDGDQQMIEGIEPELLKVAIEKMGGI